MGEQLIDAMANLREEETLRIVRELVEGGGQISESVAKYAGADAYREDAQRAVLLAKEWAGV